MLPDSMQSRDWSRTIPVFVVVLVVLSGCQAVPGDSDGVPDPTEATTTLPTTDDAANATDTETAAATTTGPDRDIEVSGGSLPLDPNVVWARVAALVDTGVGPPSEVRIENLSTGSPVTRTPFQRSLGVPAPNRSGFLGYAPASWSGSLVKLHRGLIADETQLEATLAHEYVHVVQLRNRDYEGVLRTIDEDDDYDYSTDETLVHAAVTEGAATYVEGRYVGQHLGIQRTGDRAYYLNATSTAKQGIAPYYFGARYVDATVDGPDALEALYEDPPRTTEELLHALEPGSEPPAALSVSVDSERRVEQWGPYGELFVRTLFGTALDEPAAAQLADGWGTDTRLRFGTPEDGEAGDYAWVLRWDDAANATEFEDGVAAYLDAREPNASVRVDRVAPETTVLFVGSESFVGNATASGRNASVTVST